MRSVAFRHAGAAARLTALLAIVACVGIAAVRALPLQWDLDACLIAARAAHAGLDPYAAADLGRIAQRPVTLPFVYPPVGLVPFLGLALLPPATAATLWITVKVVALAGLVAAWIRWAPGVPPLAVALVAVFGWNGAALWDLTTGNVALLETALLWTGFACWATGRPVAFAALVVLAACFKLTPAAYLVLLLVPAGGRAARPRLFAGALAALALVVAGPLFVGPAARWDGFLTRLPPAIGIGEANPSAFALAAVIAERFGARGDAVVPAALGVWVVWVAALAAASAGFLRDAWRAGDPVRWVFALVVLDLLVSPRPMSYGFVRLGPAPLALVAAAVPRPSTALALALLVAAPGLARAARHTLPLPLVEFAPLFTLLALWLIATRHRAAGAAADAVTPPPALSRAA